MNPSGSDVAFAFTPILYKRTLRVPPWGDNFLCKASKIDNISHFSGRSKGAGGTTPGGPNSFNFVQFLGKFGKIVCLCAHPESWRPPPRGNPGSATAFVVSITFPMILSGRLQKSLKNRWI